MLGKQETGTSNVSPGYPPLLVCALAGFQGSSGQAQAQRAPNSPSTSAAAPLFSFSFAPLLDFFASLEAIFPTSQGSHFSNSLSGVSKGLGLCFEPVPKFLRVLLLQHLYCLVTPGTQHQSVQQHPVNKPNSARAPCRARVRHS